MKKILILSSLLIFIFLPGCEKFLDEEPLAEIGIGQFYKSKFDADAAMAGMYSTLATHLAGGPTNHNDRLNYYGEYRSDNFERHGGYTNNNVDQLSFNTLNPDNTYSDWTGFYKIIGRANNNIKYIPTITSDFNLTPAISNRYVAESHAVRAISYFYIVRVWGDAPVWLEPYENLADEPNRAREPVDKIINEVIIKDLETAYGLITKDVTPIVYNVGEAAVCAALADVYMWKKDYPNAIKWFQNLFKARNPKGTPYAGISDANLQPTATWKSIFTAPSGSIEAIWNLHWDPLKNGDINAIVTISGSNKPMIIDLDVFNTYFASYRTVAGPDIRIKQTVDVYRDNAGSNFSRDRVIKYYPTPAAPTTSPASSTFAKTIPVYFPMYRLGGMYLLYAEALNGSGDLAGALKYLNFIRKRAGISQYVASNPAVASKAAMENTILQERQIELFAEGKRWFDLVRTGKVKEVMDPVLIRRQTAATSPPIGFDDIRTILWPISRTVINSNSNLVQNPAYSQ